MAAEQKKKPASGGSRKRTSSTSKRGRPPSKSSASSKKKPALRREVWGLVYALLGIITAFSLFHFDGFVLKWYFSLIAGLIGWGTYMMPIALFAAAVLMFVKHSGPVRLRTFSILFLPVCFGAIVHSVMIGSNMTFAMKTIAELAQTGVALKSGGLLAGTISMAFSSAFSQAGGFILLIILTVACVMTACHLTPLALWEYLKTPEYEDDEEAEEEPKVRQPLFKPKAKAEPSAKRIDIPLDDSVGTLKAKKVKSPADYLEELQEAQPPAVSEQAVENIAPFAETSVAVKEPPIPDISSLIQKPEPVAQAGPASEPKPDVKPDKAVEEAAKNQVAADLAQAIDESIKAPAPVYLYPSLDLLTKGKSTAGDATAELAESSQRLIDTLQSFGIEATIINIVRGPSVTRFEMQIERGIKFSRITALSDDIALSLGAVSVRIAPIPDKVAIGIEVPNKSVQMVFIREVIGSKAFDNAKSRLTFAIGKDITGAAMVGDIAKMPHMLIAGTTGSGKSVCINSMLISLLYKSTPEEVRLIMVDPKMVELGNYNGIPHLLIPVVTDPKKASGALNWAVGEMERRYTLFAEQGVRDLASYNTEMKRKKESGEEGEWATLPQIVIVIDELADLMMVAAKEVETSICRIAQKARAAGMHLVVATQRPSADVITGIMKSNIPSRIAFAVASQIESRIILDGTGAEKLIGKGDMLYAPLGMGKPTRVQGCFISSEEIERVISHIKTTASVEYNEEILAHIEKQAESSASASGAVSGGDGDEDELLPQAIEIVVDSGQASVSMLQRRLKLGYSRAARLVDQMEERGIVGPFEGSKPRQVLISREDWQEMTLRRMD